MTRAARLHGWAVTVSYHYGAARHAEVNRAVRRLLATRYALPQVPVEAVPGMVTYRVQATDAAIRAIRNDVVTVWLAITGLTPGVHAARMEPGTRPPSTPPLC